MRLFLLVVIYSENKKEFLFVVASLLAAEAKGGQLQIQQQKSHLGLGFRVYSVLW
jgi:hypothetical protein